MSDPLQSWLSLSRAVKDISGSNAKWDSLARTQANQLNNFTFTLPAFDVAGITKLASVPLIFLQYNFSFPQPFTILNWQNIINQVVPILPGFMVGLRYRQGTNVVRYIFNDIVFAGTIYTAMSYPKYTGQLIKPNFCLELWTPSISAFYPGPTLEFRNLAPITFITSCQFLPQGISNINADIPLVSIANGKTEAPADNGQLFQTLPVNNPPPAFDATGPFLDNI